MRFQLAVRPEDEQSFHARKLREIVLLRQADGVYALHFLLADEMDATPGTPGPAIAQRAVAGSGPLSSVFEPAGDLAPSGEIPEYIMVEEAV